MCPGIIQEEVMTGISSLSGVSGIQPNQNSNARLQAAIARLVGLPGLFPTTDSVSGLSTVAKLQAQKADIRQLSVNIAQSVSLSQVADNGVSNIQQAVQQLQSLAQQARAETSTPESRATLNTQFQQVAQQINEIVASTNFNGQSLLDGSLSGSGSISLASAIVGDSENTGAGDLFIADLSASTLLNGSLDILTSENASQAIETLGNTLQNLGGVRNDISVFQQALDFAAANVDSVLANQQAAESAIRDGDDLGSGVSSNIQQNAGSAVAAQAGQLSPTLLRLIS
jgi:flagellin